MKDVARGFDYEKALGADPGHRAQEALRGLARLPEEGLRAHGRRPPRCRPRWARLLIKGSEDDPYNIAPSSAPTASSFIFISSRDLFSIDMFMGDAKTGKITRKITSTAVDPHFQSIQFINSAGSWDADGQRFVFGAVSEGKPVLAFLDEDGQRIGEDILFPELGEILNPTWSPDGKRIAFSALTGGYSDLYIYDLETKDPQEHDLRSLTATSIRPGRPTANGSPSSPSGSPPSCPILSIGNYRAGPARPRDRRDQASSCLSAGAKHINPAVGGRLQVASISSPTATAISNLYRLDMATRGLFQVTDLYTGVSGITNLSPALSIASKSNDILYSVYDEGNLQHLSASTAKLHGRERRSAARRNTVFAAILPPRDRAGLGGPGPAQEHLFGLPDPAKFTTAPYKPKLSLDYVCSAPGRRGRRPLRRLRRRRRGRLLQRHARLSQPDGHGPGLQPAHGFGRPWWPTRTLTTG